MPRPRRGYFPRHRGDSAQGRLGRREHHGITDSLPINSSEARWAGIAADHFSAPSIEEKKVLRAQLAAELNISAEDLWVGNLAALVPHKDHDTLLAAALIVLLKHPKTVFLIAGDGPEGPRLREQVKQLGLQERVLLLGQRGDSFLLLKSLDVFVLSSWGEGMGSVLLEASACRTAIAATTAGGIPEIVTDGQSGLLAPPRSPEALAAVILRLLKDVGLRERLSAKAAENLKTFGLGSMAQKMEEVYETVTDSHNHR